MARKTVLIIDDNKNLVNGVEMIIEFQMESDIKVLTAYDGEEGLKLALRKHPQLILLDLNIPKLNGYRLLQKFQERQIDSRVLLLTGGDQVPTLEGVNGYLTKPIRPDQLIQAINRELKGGQS
ncbi:MAG: response regulator [Calditrichae bacterium]|nr:response regulator [Calditrichia bacterium]NIW78345.1 response regulator [Calditrichia bacterium]